MEYLIETYSNPGDTVLDNTMGSGTTGVACVRTDRNFVGMESDAEYYNLAQERINNTVPVEEVAQESTNPLLNALS